MEQVRIDRSAHTRKRHQTEFIVNTDMVEKAIGALTGKKAAGSDNVSEEHLLYAPGCAIAHLANLFNGMLKHGYLPNSLTEGIIIPISLGIYLTLQITEGSRCHQRSLKSWSWLFLKNARTS